MGVRRLLAATVCGATLITPILATIYWAGIDESGGEFAPGVLPGAFGVDYAFVNNSAVDVYVEESNVNLFRVAFLLERMCPPEYGLGSKFNETYFMHYKNAIDHITLTRGAYAILDPHNYMRYNDASEQPISGSIIGNWSDPKAATTQQFGEFWGELASRFKHNEKVIFGLMNEPWGTSTSLVLKNDQAAIDHIRTAGCEQLILAPGNDWTGGHSWHDNGEDSNANWMWKLRDPMHNTAIDIHEYLDVDFSGSHVDCVSDPRIFLANLTSWLEDHNFMAMITEFGGSNTTGCYDMLKILVDYMEDNPVYIGWSMWAAGPLWGSQSACCESYGLLGSLEPDSLAIDGSPGLYEQVWVTHMKPLVPEELVWSGLSSVRGGKRTLQPQNKRPGEQSRIRYRGQSFDQSKS